MKAELDSLFLLSLSARDGHSVAEREQANLPLELQQNFLQGVYREALSGNSDSGLFYVQTCHRIEFYAFGIEAKVLWNRWRGLCGPATQSARFLTGQDALEHLIRVTASLESEVLGETQITGQIREAADRARKLGVLRGPLDRCVQQALRVAKRLRSETTLSEGTVSVAHVAVDGLSDVFDSMEGKSALVVGAGSMAVQALERLKKLGVRDITWVSRNVTSMAHLSLAQDCRLDTLENLHRLVWNHSITVTATSSPQLLLLRERLERERPAQCSQSSPRVILDLGLPRNAEESIHGFQGFYLRNVDEFNNHIERNSQKRRSQLQAAENILAVEMQNFLKAWNSWGRAPLMTDIYQGLEALRIQELSEAGHTHLKLEENPKMEYVTRSILAKLMHRLVEELENIEEPVATQVLDTLACAWRHPDQWSQRQQKAAEKRARAPAAAPKLSLSHPRKQTLR